MPELRFYKHQQLIQMNLWERMAGRTTSQN